MRKILVADTTIEFCTAVTKAFAGKYQVTVCHEGRTALETICKEAPDVLWLDIALPGMDGLTILQAIKRVGICPKVIACARLPGEYVQMTLEKEGVSYLMLKPVSIPAAIARLDDLAKAFAEEHERTRAELLYELLLPLGLTGKRTGHRCLHTAVLMKAEDRELQVTKTLYPEVAKALNNTKDGVERAIRRELTEAFGGNYSEFWHLHFPDYTDKCPSNGVFIDTIAECLRQLLSAQQTSGK